MAKKSKIRKNLTDADMLANYKEEPSLEDIFNATQPAASSHIEESTKESFLTPELQEKVSKALLELKVKLYKEGIIDYNIKVTCAGNQVLLTAVPSSRKKK